MGFELGWVDIGLIVFITLSVIVGLVRGFVFELLSLAGWFVAYFVALWFTPQLQSYVHVGEPGSALNYGATFACVFLASLVIWSLAARLVRMLIRATPLSLFDRLLGAGFGLLRGLVVLLVVATLVSVSPLSQSAAWRQSRGAVWLATALQELRPLFANEVSQHLST
jgi:membrane protein required for colicin V production